MSYLISIPNLKFSLMRFKLPASIPIWRFAFLKFPSGMYACSSFGTFWSLCDKSCICCNQTRRYTLTETWQAGESAQLIRPICQPLESANPRQITWCFCSRLWFLLYAFHWLQKVNLRCLRAFPAQPTNSAPGRITSREDRAFGTYGTHLCRDSIENSLSRRHPCPLRFQNPDFNILTISS